ncbi:MAG: pentapeptide repeat-containing protein [Cyanobacteria bacterium P01_F01_bin.143]
MVIQPPYPNYHCVTMKGRFITTQALEIKGERGEQVVWEAIQTAFSERDCLAYWRYPIFDPRGRFRKEPDILIADYDLGLIVIEVKAIAITNIVGINGHRWQYKDFYTNYGNPYQQAESQLFTLLEYSDREAILRKQIAARVLIALPYITQEEWQAKGFAGLPSNPPILFKNHLEQPHALHAVIQASSALRLGRQLTATQWELLLATLAGTSIYQPELPQTSKHKQSRSQILHQARSRLNQLDLQQEQIAKQIPPGMQRIRGVAGSGKTVILCQKAALMHLKYPQWRIALVFFSRNLYEVITEQVNRWIQYFTNGKQQYDAQKSSLKILHAWGSKNQPGFYSTICNLTRKRAIPVSETVSRKPNEALGEVCLHLLETTAIPQVFDAILIDEAQDLLVEQWQYQDKQPFFWLAYQALRSVNPVHPQQKRLIWAYDEMQNLSSSIVPTAGELFGEELAHLVAGEHVNKIPKTINLTRCYRSPDRIVNIANAIAMGYLNSESILTGFNYEEEWQAIGYQVTGKLESNNQIILQYQAFNNANSIEELWPDDIISFQVYNSHYQELIALANNIKYNLSQDNLLANDILVIPINSSKNGNFLVQQTANFLSKQGLSIFLPGSKSTNSSDSGIHDTHTNKFWSPGSITIANSYRTKGQEAAVIYIIGLDNLAKDANNLALRNQLFIALTRTQGWGSLSGIGDYDFYQELEQVIANGNKFEFIFSDSNPRGISISDRANMLRGYALGRRNFSYANLQNANLANKNLANINLIAANLVGSNLENTNLSGAKLIEANLTNANLKGANLLNAKLMGADLTDAILTNTIFE